MGKVYIGTSGWQYSHWQGIFYPENLPQKDWLRYYSDYFDTVEVNATFYHQMKKETFKKWRETVGDDFVFSIKGSRFISHVKRLKDCQEAVNNFMESVSGLFSEAGPSFVQPPPEDKRAEVARRDNVILWQLPPQMKADGKRLEKFLQLVHSQSVWRHAFEFRHKSWLNQETYSLLKEANCALVIQDSPYWPTAEVVTADFVYLRFHGKESLYASCYPDSELDEWAKKMKQWLKKGLDVYGFFNNDAQGYAIANAQTLKKLLGNKQYQD